jgi:Ran GTPase-activating protein (RanGAP) involved in mRNA processing and transport
LAEGLVKNTTLEHLNIKGNVIGDSGMILLASALRNGCRNLKELDVSLNEIGPQGFQALCEVLPQTNIQTLVCNKNFLGDEILAFFS